MACKQMQIFEVEYRENTYIAPSNIIKTKKQIYYFKENPIVFGSYLDYEAAYTDGAIDKNAQTVLLELESDSDFSYDCYVFGVLHRTDGRASYYDLDNSGYYIDGFWYETEEEWFAVLTPEQKDNYIWKL